MKSADKATSITVAESRFYNNTAGGTESTGGAIATDGSSMSILVNGTVSFENNSAARGGAIEASNGAEVLIVDAIFNSNRASDGGALFGQVCFWCGRMELEKHN